MGRIGFGVLGFVAGAAVASAFAYWYVNKHYLGLGGEALAGKLGLGETGTKVLGGVFDALDTVRQ